MFYLIFSDAFIGQYVGTISAYDPDRDAVLTFYFADPKTASSDEGYVVDPNNYNFTVIVSSFLVVKYPLQILPM